MSDENLQPADEPAIVIESLRVDYGEVHAVADVSLQIDKGQVFGLIGPNGAGKSTTIRVLAGLLKPTYGAVRVAGIDIVEEPEHVRPLLGYMPDLAPIYDDLTVQEFLTVFAGAYRLPMQDRARRVSECIEMVQLEAKTKVLCNELSRGMRQRLVLAKTLIHDPEILFLDEPASGLDPHARIGLRDTIRELAASGKTVLVSSHILTEMSEFCTSIGIMEQGRMIACGTIDEVKQKFSHSKTLVIEVLDDGDHVANDLQANSDVSSLERSGGSITLVFGGDENDMAQLLGELAAKYRVKTFYERTMDVEDIFMKVGAKELS